MTTRTLKLYLPVPLQNNDSEQKLETKLNDASIFNNSNIRLNQMKTYFKNKNQKSKRKPKNYKTLTSLIESVETVVFTGATSTSVTLSIADVGLVVTAVSAEIACALILGTKVIQKIFEYKQHKYEKQNEKDRQTIKTFDR